MFILINKKFYDLFILLIKKKLKFKKKYKKVVTNLILYCKFFFLSKKKYINFFIFYFSNFFLWGNKLYFNYFKFYINWKFFFTFYNLYNIILSEQSSILSKFYWFKWVNFGLVAESLGFQFLGGSLIQFVYRIFFFISIIFNNILYYSINFKKRVDIL